MAKPFDELRRKMSREARVRSEQMTASLREAIRTDLSPDEQKRIDNAWAEEAQRRLAAYREGKIRIIPVEEVFPELD